MNFSEIKVVEKGSEKQVFIGGVEQKNIAKVEIEVLPMEITVVKVSYYTDKFELIREDELVELDEYGFPTVKEVE